MYIAILYPVLKCLNMALYFIKLSSISLFTTKDKFINFAYN